MCVIFPVEIDVSQTVIQDCQIDKHVRELVYINKIMNSQVTKPILMMFNISGPIRNVTRKSNNLRSVIKSKIYEPFERLECDNSDQVDSCCYDDVKYFKSEYYSVSCQSGNVLKTNFAKILKSHDYCDSKAIKSYEKYCLPKLVDANNYYVAVCVLKPGFEKSDDQVLSFEYNPIGKKIVIPIAHEINDKGVYEYDVAVYVDNVQFDGEQFEEFVKSLSLPSSFNKDSEKVLYYNEHSKNKRMIYKAVEFTTDSNDGKGLQWKIFSNGFIYNKKTKVLYIKLHNVTSVLNKNVILNIY
ncbi:p35 protein [Thysanoplusia orichalcea nucleopolyhedrovirus]|uniref:p35 protein n=1 Tax=Thysanoplusia orichalcea nucleopolyhedrovirus TaxID=101850 RepID=L0CLT1_9ABAC|nr:p35 protein [Thysanoplusia orichalcea nucleopolyhedrovirus]AGA16283.1 p35 protein [Thysanoplusia orichalcea nucleopolyhedrovirus]